jgi:hypothetical protein
LCSFITDLQIGLFFVLTYFAQGFAKESFSLLSASWGKVTLSQYRWHGIALDCVWCQHECQLRMETVWCSQVDGVSFYRMV